MVGIILETVAKVAVPTFLSTETAPCLGSFLLVGGRASSWGPLYLPSELSRFLLAMRKCARILLGRTFSFGTHRFRACYHMHPFHSSLTAWTSWIFLFSHVNLRISGLIIPFFLSILSHPRSQIGGTAFYLAITPGTRGCHSIRDNHSFLSVRPFFIVWPWRICGII